MHYSLHFSITSFPQTIYKVYSLFVSYAIEPTSEGMLQTLDQIQKRTG